MVEKVTLEDLAKMTADGFFEIGEKIDKNRSAIEKNRMAIEKNRMAIEKNSERIDNLASQIEMLRKEVTDIRKKLDKTITQKQFFELEERLTIVENKLGIKY